MGWLPGIKADLDERHQLWLEYTALADASQAEANAALLPFDRPIPIIVDDITSFFYLHMPNGDPILHQQKQAEADAYYAQATTAKTYETTYSNQLARVKAAAINSYSAGQLAELEYHAAISAAKRYEVIAQGYTTSANLIDAGSSPLEPNPLSIANDVDAAGRIKQFALGNGLTSNRRYDQSHGFLTDITTGNTGTNGWTVQSLAFDYDEIGNLKQRKNHLSNKTEIFHYDGVNRLDDVTEGSQIFDYNYATNGNITEKDGYTYDYSGATSGPHAVDSRSKTDANGTHVYDYAYDTNGNQTTATGPSLNRNIIWADFNKPRRISNNSAQLDFVYSPAHSRLKQTAIADTALAATTTKTILYLGAGYEQIINPNGELEHKHHIAVPGATVIDTQKGDGTSSTQYSLSDHLGSTDVVVGIDPATPAPNPGEHPHPKPQETQRLSFGPFGESRDPVTHDPKAFDDSQTSRGYTGHEMLNLVGLIHMNGRIYDPALGRMLSADPNIQAPASVQNHNRYSYVNNNPLSYTDPSGYFFKKLFRKLGQFLRDHGAALIAVAIMSIPGCQGFQLYMQGFTATMAATGGNFRAAVVGGFSAMAFNWVGSNVPAGPGKVLTHGVVGGMSSALSGGNLRDGFVGSVVSQSLAQSGAYEYLGFNNPDGFGERASNVVVSAVIGGTASALSGGKFRNGAMSAAFSRMFNDLALSHQLKRRRKTGTSAWEKPLIRNGKRVVSTELVEPTKSFNFALTGKIGVWRQSLAIGLTSETLSLYSLLAVDLGYQGLQDYHVYELWEYTEMVIYDPDNIGGIIGDPMPDIETGGARKVPGAQVRSCLLGECEQYGY